MFIDVVFSGIERLGPPHLRCVALAITARHYKVHLIIPQGGQIFHIHAGIPNSLIIEKGRFFLATGSPAGQLASWLKCCSCIYFPKIRGMV